MSTSAALAKPFPACGDPPVPLGTDSANAGRNRKALRFPLALPVRYRTDDDAGVGEILNISSCGALFTTERPLALNADARLSVKWPVLLSNSVHLTLVVAGKIVRVEAGRAALEIQKYEFRTCSPSFFLAPADQNVSCVGLGLQVQVADHAVQRIGM
ncbi:MAG: PilZ domain-containing protein [Bryobacteraceae bacterium]